MAKPVHSFALFILIFTFVCYSRKGDRVAAFWLKAKGMDLLSFRACLSSVLSVVALAKMEASCEGGTRNPALKTIPTCRDSATQNLKLKIQNWLRPPHCHCEGAEGDCGNLNLPATSNEQRNTPRSDSTILHFAFYNLHFFRCLYSNEKLLLIVSFTRLHP